MSVSEFIYNLLFTAYPNRVFYEFFPDAVDLNNVVPNVLIINTVTTGDNNKNGAVRDESIYEFHIVAHKDSHLACKTLTKNIRDILTDIEDQNYIMEVEFESERSEPMMNAAEKQTEATRVILELRFYTEPNT